MMRSLKIDFVPQRGMWRWFGILLLGCALLLAVGEVRSYLRKSKELVLWESALSALKRPGKMHPANSKPVPDLVNRQQLQTEFKAARRTIDRLSMPWNDLFEQIESVSGDQVTLLSIEPDPERKELLIVAEAKDFVGLLAYTRELDALEAMTDVYVLSHQMQSQDQQKPVRFTIAAKWITRPYLDRE